MPLSGTSASGSIYNCGQYTQAAQLNIGGTTYLANFAGNMELRLDPAMLAQYLNGSASSVPLRLQEFECNGFGALIGPITMAMDPDRAPPPGALRAITGGQPFPAIEDHIVHIHVAIPNFLPGTTLRNKIPPNAGQATLRNSNTTHFPPKNAIYQLVEPIELEDLNNPGPVLATIQSFTMMVNPSDPWPARRGNSFSAAHHLPPIQFSYLEETDTLAG